MYERRSAHPGQAAARKGAADDDARPAAADDRAQRPRSRPGVARRLFADRGYAATGMDDVAAACGVTKPMLYAYFGSKDGLFARCVQAAGVEFRAQVRAAAGTKADAPPDQRLWAGLLAVFARIEADREAWDLLYPLDGPPPGGALGHRAAFGVEAMAELVEELMAGVARAHGLSEPLAAQTAPLARALAGAVMALADWWRRHPEEPKELQALRAMNFAWRGLEGMLEQRYWIPVD